MVHSAANLGCYPVKGGGTLDRSPALSQGHMETNQTIVHTCFLCDFGAMWSKCCFMDWISLKEFFGIYLHLACFFSAICVIVICVFVFTFIVFSCSHEVIPLMLVPCLPSLWPPLMLFCEHVLVSLRSDSVMNKQSLNGFCNAVVNCRSNTPRRELPWPHWISFISSSWRQCRHVLMQTQTNVSQR